MLGCDLAPCSALNHARYRYTWMVARLLYDIEHKKNNSQQKHGKTMKDE
jgi:hypothetical protein